MEPMHTTLKEMAGIVYMKGSSWAFQVTLHSLAKQANGGMIIYHYPYYTLYVWGRHSRPIRPSMCQFEFVFISAVSHVARSSILALYNSPTLSSSPYSIVGFWLWGHILTNRACNCLLGASIDCTPPGRKVHQSQTSTACADYIVIYAPACSHCITRYGMTWHPDPLAREMRLAWVPPSTFEPKQPAISVTVTGIYFDANFVLCCLGIPRAV